MTNKKKIYFASDVHLGLPNFEKSLKREKHFVKWLDSIKHDAEEIYLMGDIFDFWFEYKKVVPRGFTRFLGKLCELTDNGIPVHFFTGNHDMWIFGYLPKETGVQLYREPISRDIMGKKFYLGHGDGLGPGDNTYKILKRIFASKLMQWFFARFHPNFSFGIAHAWSYNSRYSKVESTSYMGDEKEWLTIYAKELIEKVNYDYILFGHRHLPHDISLNNGKTRLINTGDWLGHYSYGVFDGDKFEIKNFPLEG